MPGFHEGMAAVQLKESGWGYLDKSGAQLVPLGYYGAGDFSDSRSLVWKIKTQNTLGSPFEFLIIDKSGAKLAGPFGYALPSGSGMFSVSDDFANWKLLDQQFHTVCVFKHFSSGCQS